MVDLFRNQRWDLVSKRGLYYVISGLVLLAGIVAMVYNGVQTGKVLNWGIDFTGGSKVGVVTTQRMPVDKHIPLTEAIRANLGAAGITDANVQILPGMEQGTRDGIEVRTPKREDMAAAQPAPAPAAPATPPAEGAAPAEGATAPAAGVPAAPEAPAVTAPAAAPGTALSAHSASILKAIEDATKAQGVELKLKTDGTVDVNSENVSGTIQDKLIANGLMALILGTLLILGWIWIRYNIGGFGLRYSAAGMIALLHDLGMLVGIFALSRTFFGEHGLVVNSPFIAALLTVLGYSIHDTIVLFDRVRENVRLRKGRTFAETINISLLETLARSVNTVVTTLFPLLALLVLGGPNLRDFVAAMIIGLMLGGLSSIFIASQLLVSWSKGRDRLMPGFDGTIVGEAPVPVMAAAGSVPVAVQAEASAPTASSEAASSAIQRAKQAGKTAKRKR